MNWLSQHPLECTFQKVMLSEILKLMSLIILHEWVYQGYLTLKFAVLTKRVQHVKRNFLFANQILSSSVPFLIVLWNYYNFFNGPEKLLCKPLLRHHKRAKQPSSFVIVNGHCKERSPEKKCFLWNFFLIRGGGGRPILLVNLKEVHFWSIKDSISSKMPIICTWNFFLDC